MPVTESIATSELISIAIGRWGVATAPAVLRTLLGSCVGVIIHDRTARAGGLAHIVLPDSRGQAEHPGKYADTAIPGMLADLEKLVRGKPRSRWVAKMMGGAAMFQANGAVTIGQRNHEAVEAILSKLGIPIIARDVGGEAGRRVTLDVETGIATIRIPGGADYGL